MKPPDRADGSQMDDIGAGPGVDVSEGRLMRKETGRGAKKAQPTVIADSSDDEPEMIDEKAERRKDRKAAANVEVRQDAWPARADFDRNSPRPWASELSSVPCAYRRRL